MIPESRAAVQATMGTLASVGRKLVQKVLSSALSHQPYHHLPRPPSERHFNLMPQQLIHPGGKSVGTRA